MTRILLLPFVACEVPEPGDPSQDPTTHAEADTDTDADSDADADTDTDADSDVDDPFVGWTRVDDGADAVVVGSEALAIAPDGTVLVSYAVDGDGSVDVRLARSTDGGASFEAPVLAESGALAPLVSMARRPWLATDGDRIALVFADDDAAYVALSDAAALAFAEPVASRVEAGVFVDFPRSAFGPDGDLWVAYQSYPASGAAMFVGRESAGFVPQIASGGAPGVPCECCPLELAFDAAGAALLAFRNNDADRREVWVARAEPGATAFSGWSPASASEGVVPTCPMQGPRMAELPGGDLLLGWSSRGASPGRAMVSASTDGGRTWGPDRPVTPLARGDAPTLAAGPTGTLWLTAGDGPDGASLVSSPDSGLTWTAPDALDGPGGRLVEPQLAAGAGRVALAGTTSSGEVWLRVLE